MKVTALSGTDYPVTEESYAQVAWLLKKYTSFSYIERCYRLLATFTREYEAFAGSGKGQFPNHGYRDILIHLYDFQARFERGLGLLRRGDRSGYREIRVACEVSNYLFGGPTEHGEQLEEVGFRRWPQPSIGILVWADRSADMAVAIRWTLAVEWTFERLFIPPIGPPPPLPKVVPPVIRPHRVEILGRSDEVTRAGIWQPIDVPKGCPNLLRPGMKGVPVNVPYERVDDPLRPGEPPLRPTVTYEFKSVATRWQLLWEDTRYKDGVIPDESEYLDTATAFPDDGLAPAPGIPQ